MLFRLCAPRSIPKRANNFCLSIRTNPLLTNLCLRGRCSHALLERGHSQLGEATVIVCSVFTPPERELSRNPKAVLAVTLQVVLHGPRTLQLRRGGRLGRVDACDEDAYSAGCTLAAHCVVNPDGTIMPDAGVCVCGVLCVRAKCVGCGCGGGASRVWGDGWMQRA